MITLVKGQVSMEERVFTTAAEIDEAIQALTFAKGWFAGQAGGTEVPLGGTVEYRQARWLVIHHRKWQKDIFGLLEQGNRIAAIKLFRQVSGMGLLESKNYIDRVFEDRMYSDFCWEYDFADLDEREFPTSSTIGDGYGEGGLMGIRSLRDRNGNIK